MLALIPTIQNIHDIQIIPTKCGEFLLKFMAQQDSRKKLLDKGKICCHGLRRFQRHRLVKL